MYNGDIAVFDLETTGVSVEHDRIVTAFVGRMSASGEMIESHSWVIDPGVDIPDGAAEVHGYTTERVRAEGRKDARNAVFEIAQRLDIYDREGLPVTIYNANYDLTLLDREMRRHGFNTFRAPRIVIDPLVIDKQVDKYRKGSRKLVDTAPIYGVKVLENAHDAEADCTMTGQVALKLLQHPKLKDLTLEQIHAKTVASKKEQADSFRAYKVKQALVILDKDEREAAIANAKTISGEWPMVAWVGA